MTFDKTSLFNGDAVFSGWCTCQGCDDKNGPPHSEYNQRSGPNNPQQNASQ